MNVEKIKNALNRKIGPLPAWAWAIVAGLGIYFYRSRSGKLNQPTPLTPSQDNALPPQEQVQLQPGESVYDPNTGALTTAPGGADPNAQDASNANLAAAYNKLADAIAGGLTVNQPAPDKTNPKGEKPVRVGGRAKRAMNKPAKDKRPLPERGHKREPKGKPHAHKSPGRGTSQHPHGNPPRARSGSNVRNRAGGRTTGRQPQVHERLGRPRATATPQNQSATPLRPRTGIRAPMVSAPAPVQHGQSAHQPQNQPPHTTHTPTPRPSSPPPRQQTRRPPTRPAARPAAPRGQRGRG